MDSAPILNVRWHNATPQRLFRHPYFLLSYGLGLEENVPILCSLDFERFRHQCLLGACRAAMNDKKSLWFFSVRGGGAVDVVPAIVSATEGQLPCSMAS